MEDPVGSVQCGLYLSNVALVKLMYIEEGYLKNDMFVYAEYERPSLTKIRVNHNNAKNTNFT